jgi:hypothetical protein
MATEPRYTFDPVTQTYKRIDTPVTTPVRGLGPLYDAGGGVLSGIPSMATKVAGAVATGVPSLFGMATPQPVAPDTTQVTGISPNQEPTAALAALNAQSKAEENDNTAQAQQAAALDAAATAAMGDPTVSVSDPAVDAAENAAAPAADSSGGGDNNFGSDAMDSYSPPAGDEGEKEGGLISMKRSGPGSDPSADFNKGGLAAAAQSVQDQGRGDDKILVHMTPNEVRGLQAIAMQHGGSLTVNPETGLVEAGFLDSILPMVAGAALTIGSGGVINPYMSAAIVGGVTGLTSGSLEKGLMAGLGAFGGAGIGTALAAPAVTGTQAGLQAAGQQALGTTALPAGVTAGGGAQASALMQQNIAMGMTPAEAAAQIAGSASYAPAALAKSATLPGPGATWRNYCGCSPANLYANGLQVIQGSHPKGRAAFMTAAGGATGLITKGAMAAAPLAGAMFSAEEPDVGGKKPQEYIRPYSFDFNRADADPEFKYRTGAPGESTAEQRYFAPEFKGLGVYKAGTEPGPSFYGKPTAEQLALYSKPKDSPTGLKAGGLAGLGRGGLRDGAFIVPADVVAHLGNGSNDAGQKILARGLGSRPIKGKGDGMSDSIPTSIEGKQPARVADGEAYIPPEVVKKVGSKRLYAMMDKIRQARTGTKKQAPEVNPRQFMPA